MNKNFSIILIFILLTAYQCYAQNKGKYNGLYSFKNNAYSYVNLKDSVSSVKSYYTKIRESATKTDQNRFISNNDLMTVPALIEFNKYSELRKTFSCGITFKGYEYDLLCTNLYEFDEKDINIKAKYKIEFEQKFPVMNRSLLMKPNENSFYYGSYYDKNGKPAKSLSQTVYQYNFDKSGRIKEELEYCPYAEDSIPVKTIKKSDLNTRKIFLYNKKNQVVVLKITPGEYGKNMGHYNDFATEIPYCQDLQLKYAYDSKGRITQVIMFGCGKIVAQEDYKYDNSKNYVSEVKRYRGGLGSDDYKNTISFYNELGDIIKKELNPINPNENSIREPKYRYYDYEYDKHNNWIRCRMFLEGNHEGEPSIILEREIEYYNEQKAK